MTDNELKKFMAKGWTTRRLAIALDVTERTITRYRTGENKIPKAVELAIQNLNDNGGGKHA